MRRSPRRLDLAALLAGCLYPLGFAPFGWFPLPVLALAGLFACIAGGCSVRRAAWRGWLFGVGAFGVGISWIQVSVHQFGLPSYVFSVGVTVLFVAFMALYPALAGWATARWRRPAGARGTLAFAPAVWVATEWLRGWFLSGFPWLESGYSQIDSPIGGYAAIGGVHLVSVAVALSAGLLLTALRHGGVVRAGSVAALAVIWLVPVPLARVAWTQAAGPPLSVALLQGNVAQSVKWLAAQRQQTIATYLRLSEPHWGRDLIVWPETAVPAFDVELRDFLAAVGERARADGTHVLMGIPMLDMDSARYFNGVIALGATPGAYRKRHLVPFGEFLPLSTFIGGLLDFLDIPMSSFTAGAPVQTPVRAAGYAIGISICYEDAFGAEVRAGLPEAALLVNVSNDAWFGNSLAPHQHLEIARMRARETGRFLLRATNTGISAVIDAHGDILARAPQFEATTVAASVEPRIGSTPYVRFGDLPALTLLALMFASAARRRSAAAV